MRFKRAAKVAAFHGMILAKGFARMICGAATACMILIAVDGFAAIPQEGGYMAVCDFIAAVAILVVAIGGAYIMGGNGKKNAR